MIGFVLMQMKGCKISKGFGSWPHTDPGRFEFSAFWVPNRCQLRQTAGAIKA
jgi:hypothetical protein